MLGIIGATYQDASVWPRAWSKLATAGAWLIEATSSPPKSQTTKPTEPSVAPTQALAPVVERASATEPRLAAVSVPILKPSTELDPQAPPVDTRSAAEAKRDAEISAMRPPTNDPHRKRAEAVGLHPDISVALLKRLSDADFKAAASAIRKALTELGDDGSLVWPQKPMPSAALFRISFVPGAAPDCRRYIVAIAKDGWQTTALPMETCGVKRGSRKG